MTGSGKCVRKIAANSMALALFAVGTININTSAVANSAGGSGSASAQSITVLSGEDGGTSNVDVNVESNGKSYSKHLEQTLPPGGEVSVSVSANTNPASTSIDIRQSPGASTVVRSTVGAPLLGEHSLHQRYIVPPRTDASSASTTSSFPTVPTIQAHTGFGTQALTILTHFFQSIFGFFP